MKRKKNKAIEDFSRYRALAIEIAVAVIAPMLLGRWLDSRTGKDPWFTIAGVVLGGAAAFRSVQRVVTGSLKDLEESEESSRSEPST